ncbi:hypothetical protein C8J57DRAFT_1324129 [Mycena rebaudengoi]|nr:hypothetical protein C8J57DRAFT_1324129 [Mycena rebaudengoi]
MRQSYILITILAAASTLAAPTSRDGQIIRQDSTVNGLISEGAAIEPTQESTGDPQFILPPPAQIFALMAAASDSQPSPTIVVSATDSTIRLGPGLAALPTSPIVDSITTITPSSQDADAPRPSTLLQQKAIFAAVVILSMVAMALVVYAISYFRHQHLRRSLNAAKEEDTCGLVGAAEKQGHNSVVHITSQFPRSKFSVTSSDYPCSVRISAAEESIQSSSSDSDTYSDREFRATEEGFGLMEPGHFFAMRASSMSTWSHSRGGSAPVFGVPRFDARRESSRRSRSVSGSVGEAF